MRVKFVEKITGSSSLMVILILSLLVPLLLATGSVEAQRKKAKSRALPEITIITVRGRVDRRGDSKSYPAAYVKVTLVPYIYKDNIERAMLVYTGTDGMYYFRVSPGMYVLKIWTSEKESKAFVIQATNQEYVDIAPIVIP